MHIGGSTLHSVPSSCTYTMSTSTDSKYSTTCLLSTLVSTYSWLVSTLHSVPSSCTYTMSTSTDSKYSTTCLLSTLVSTYSWLVSTLHSVPSSCTLCQPVLIVSTSDKKYKFSVPFKVLTNLPSNHDYTFTLTVEIQQVLHRYIQ